MNGEAVYGAGPTPFGEELGEPSSSGAKDGRGNPLFLSRNEYRVTTKPGRLYVTLFREVRVPFALPPMKNTVRKAYQLADGRPVEVKVEEGQARLLVERPIVDPMATVIVVESRATGSSAERPYAGWWAATGPVSPALSQSVWGARFLTNHSHTISR